MIKKANRMLRMNNGGQIRVSREDRAFLENASNSSTKKVKIEYLGFGRITGHNSQITLEVNRDYVIAGTAFNCPFSFSDFFEGEYGFYWRTHCTNKPFSHEDLHFSEITGIPGLLIISDGKISFLTIKGKISL